MTVRLLLTSIDNEAQTPPSSHDSRHGMTLRKSPE